MLKNQQFTWINICSFYIVPICMLTNMKALLNRGGIDFKSYDTKKGCKDVRGGETTKEPLFPPLTICDATFNLHIPRASMKNKLSPRRQIKEGKIGRRKDGKRLIFTLASIFLKCYLEKVCVSFARRIEFRLYKKCVCSGADTPYQLCV